MEEHVTDGGGVRKAWTVLIVGFFVVALGLIVAVAWVRFSKTEPANPTENEDGNVDMSMVAESINTALKACSDIKNDFFNGRITFKESYGKFEEAFDGGNSIYKIQLTICQANFVYKNTEDAGLAIEVMEKVDGVVDDDTNVTTKVDYYVAIFTLLYFSKPPPSLQRDAVIILSGYFFEALINL